MAPVVALLRGVNVGAANRVSMTEVRGAVAGLGFTSVRSLLQSGNLVFDAGGDEAGAIETRVEHGLADALGLRVDIVVRTRAQWRAMMEANPLSAESLADPSRVLAMVLKFEPAAGVEARLASLARDGEVVRLVGREAFIHYPNGIGASRLVGAAIDRALGARGAGRNWSTVMKLAALVS